MFRRVANAHKNIFQDRPTHFFFDPVDCASSCGNHPNHLKAILTTRITAAPLAPGMYDALGDCEARQ